MKFWIDQKRCVTILQRVFSIFSGKQDVYNLRIEATEAGDLELQVLCDHDGTSGVTVYKARYPRAGITEVPGAINAPLDPSLLQYLKIYVEPWIVFRTSVDKSLVQEHTICHSNNEILCTDPNLTALDEHKEAIAADGNDLTIFVDSMIKTLTFSRLETRAFVMSGLFELNKDSLTCVATDSVRMYAAELISHCEPSTSCLIHKSQLLLLARYLKKATKVEVRTLNSCFQARTEFESLTFLQLEDPRLYPHWRTIFEGLSDFTLVPVDRKALKNIFENYITLSKIHKKEGYENQIVIGYLDKDRLSWKYVPSWMEHEAGEISKERVSIMKLDNTSEYWYTPVQIVIAIPQIQKIFDFLKIMKSQKIIDMYVSPKTADPVFLRVDSPGAYDIKTVIMQYNLKAKKEKK